MTESDNKRLNHFLLLTKLRSQWFLKFLSDGRIKSCKLCVWHNCFGLYCKTGQISWTNLVNRSVLFCRCMNTLWMCAFFKVFCCISDVFLWCVFEQWLLIQNLQKILAFHVVGRIRTCAGNPQWISSPSP